MKICSQCGVVKEVIEFSKRTALKDGLNQRCRKCDSIYQKERYIANVEKKRARAVKDYWKDPEKAKAANNKRRREDPSTPYQNWVNHLRTLYKLTPADYGRMFADQNGACKLCNKFFFSRKDTHIDHCHETNRVRGLLCSNCNTGLGLLKDSPELLRNAGFYLTDPNWVECGTG